MVVKLMWRFLYNNTITAQIQLNKKADLKNHKIRQILAVHDKMMSKELQK